MTVRREPVVLGATTELRHGPLRLDPVLMLQAMESRVEGALVDLQDVLRNLLDAFRDRPAVQGTGLQRPEDQQVERARQDVRDGVSSHGVGCRH